MFFELLVGGKIKHAYSNAVTKLDIQCKEGGCKNDAK